MMYYAISAANNRCQRFASAAAFSGFLLEMYGPFGQAQTDEELNAYARATAGTAYHPTSTARMSAWNATDGIVNPDLTLKKARGLRIVDGERDLPALPDVEYVAHFRNDDRREAVTTLAGLIRDAAGRT